MFQNRSTTRKTRSNTISLQALLFYFKKDLKLDVNFSDFSLRPKSKLGYIFTTSDVVVANYATSNDTESPFTFFNKNLYPIHKEAIILAVPTEYCLGGHNQQINPDVFTNNVYFTGSDLQFTQEVVDRLIYYTKEFRRGSQPNTNL